MIEWTIPPRLVAAKYWKDYKILLTFADGKSGVIDLESILWGQVFEPLKDLRLFQDFRLTEGNCTIEWPSTGADLAPEYIYERIVPLEDSPLSE